MLVRVLDGLRREAIGTKYEKRYNPTESNKEAVLQARSRAFIHLFLKVMFGIPSLEDRELRVTDGAHDGGIDGYYIDSASKMIYIIQSKFRTNERNFHEKMVGVEDLLAMEIRRILGGEEIDEAGNPYNGKIKGMVREISLIPDIGRYEYRVIIIANVGKISSEKLYRLADRFQVEVYDFNRSYNELLFPILSGTYFKASDLTIQIDLSNKSAGSKISYQVSTEAYDTDITVVFVPTSEIGRVMSIYRNSILVYNPRSYLEFEGDRVNSAIRDSIKKTGDNEFALLNNGITIVSDDTHINESVGRRNKAQLHLLNPQIINGGQTAYTLSRIFDETPEGKRDLLFGGKEVLVKVITLTPMDGVVEDESKKLILIQKISEATNSQTVVTSADRLSNESTNVALQKQLFEKYGFLLERKRGEFADGLRNELVEDDIIIERTVFLRVFLAANHDLPQAVQKRIFAKDRINSPDGVTEEQLRRFMFAYYAYDFLRGKLSRPSYKNFRTLLPKVAVVVEISKIPDEGDLKESAVEAVGRVSKRWADFMQIIQSRRASKWTTDPETGNRQMLPKSKRQSLHRGLISEAQEFFAAPTP
jgi:hypothetical protein